MTIVKAVLFDLDGTLRDTNALIYESLDYAFASLGLPSPTREELTPYIHHHSFVHGAFAPGISLEEFEKTYGQRVRELLPSVVLFDLAAETLRDLRQAGYKIGIVTASVTAPMDVKDYGIDQYLDVLVSASDITAHKPDPEGVNLALTRLKIAPEEVIMVGDMPTDIQAARAAGLRASVGITHGIGSREMLQDANADYVIDSLSELPAVMKKIEQ